MNSFIISLPKAFLRRKKDSNLLLHQEATLNALRNCDIVVNDAQTGSGKTRGALLYIKDIVKDITNEYYAILYVAPVNSLVSEKTDDIYKFLKENNLDYNVFPITSATMQEIKEICKKDKYFTGRGYTNGELLTYFFKNPVSIIPYLSNVLKSILNIQEDMVYKTKPFIYLINPDILYYALFGDYYKRHKQNIHLELLENVRYIIFDEFHYYTYFQLSSFFALLSYWKMMGHFGNKDSNEKVKVCLLSATPNQFIYDTIKDKLGLQLEVINDRSLTLNECELVPFLSKVNLNVCKISNRTKFQDAMQSSQIQSKIADYIKNEEYGLIVCNSIRTANELYDFFSQQYPNKFAKITGAITDKDRKIAVNSQVIIATSTVDIGFNFKRINQPDRQNIDFLFIDFYTYDDFVQRLGRGGRLLGKTITDQYTNAYVFFHNFQFDKSKDLVEAKKNTTKSRFDLLELIKDTFPERDYYFNFFKEYGYFIVHSFVNMFKDYSLAISKSTNHHDVIIKDIITSWEELLKRIYYTHNQEKHLNRLNLLHSISKKLNFQNLLEKNKQSIAYHWLKDKEYRPSDGTSNGLEELFQRRKQSHNGILSPSEIKNEIERYSKQILGDWNVAELFCDAYQFQLDNYMSYQRMFFSSLKNNFRSSSETDITVLINDPQEIFGSKMVSYNFFHIVQYYDYDIEYDGTKNTKIRILSRLDEYRRFYFQLDLRDSINRNIFEKGIGDLRRGQYLWRLVHFKNSSSRGRTGSIKLKFEDSRPKLPVTLKNKLQKDSIGYIVPYSWNYIKINNLLRLSPYKLKVLFPNNNSEFYFIFFGRKALIARSVITEKEVSK